MILRSKTLVLLICLVLIVFKAASGSFFIQAAMERVELASCYSNASTSQQEHNSSSNSANDKAQAHTMYLMSHVTANISENSITVFLPSVTKHKFVLTNEVLFTQNFPDSVFKPPKTNAQFS